MTHLSLFESLPRGFLAVRGADRVKFLQNLLTHDIKGLAPGQGRPACLLDRHGKIRLAAIVHALPDRLLLELEAGDLERASKELETYRISEAVEFAEENPPLRVIPLHGPGAAELLSAVWPGIALPQNSLSRVEGPAGSGISSIVRWDLFRQPGFHLWVEPTREPEIRARLKTNGAPSFQAARIEAGIPWPGPEMNETVILNELGTEEWVSFTKGCFIGQEIVARIKHRAHPPRLLKGFLLEGQKAPPSGSLIRLAGEPVGVITSACFSFTLNQVIALGFLKYGLESEQVQVETPSGPIEAAVAKLPFAE